jgi:hypothetical protein
MAVTLSISYGCDLFSHLYKDLLEFEINTNTNTIYRISSKTVWVQDWHRNTSLTITVFHNCIKIVTYIFAHYYLWIIYVCTVLCPMLVLQALNNPLALGTRNEVNTGYRYSLLLDILLEQQCTYTVEERLLQKKML